MAPPSSPTDPSTTADPNSAANPDAVTSAAPPAAAGAGTTQITTVVTTTTTTTSPPTPAPAPSYRTVPLNLGVFPPLSINGSHGGQKLRNNFSAALGWSRVAMLDGIGVSLLATVVDEDATGLTASWGAAITRGTHTGIQAGHHYNHAGNLRGFQAGFVNHVGQARGVQAGLLNISRGQLRGVQIGLINYAEQADASLALIPITKEGGVRPEVWTSDTAALNVGIRLPARYTYAFFAGGLHPFGRDEVVILPVGATIKNRGASLLAGMGYGAHVPVTKRVGIDADVSGWLATAGLRVDKGAAALVKLRASLAWQLRPRIAVWGGPTLNVMVSDPDLDVPRPGYGWVAQSHTYNEKGEPDVTVRWWPGFAAGVRF